MVDSSKPLIDSIQARGPVIKPKQVQNKAPTTLPLQKDDRLTRDQSKKTLIKDLDCPTDSIDVSLVKFTNDNLAELIENEIYEQTGKNCKNNKEYREKIHKFIHNRLSGNRNSHIRNALKTEKITVKQFCTFTEKELADDAFFNNLLGITATNKQNLNTSKPPKIKVANINLSNSIEFEAVQNELKKEETTQSNPSNINENKIESQNIGEKQVIDNQPENQNQDKVVTNTPIQENTNLDLSPEKGNQSKPPENTANPFSLEKSDQDQKTKKIEESPLSIEPVLTSKNKKVEKTQEKIETVTEIKEKASENVVLKTEERTEDIRPNSRINNPFGSSENKNQENFDFSKNSNYNSYRNFNSDVYSEKDTSSRHDNTFGERKGNKVERLKEILNTSTSINKEKNLNKNPINLKENRPKLNQTYQGTEKNLLNEIPQISKKGPFEKEADAISEIDTTSMREKFQEISTTEQKFEPRNDDFSNEEIKALKEKNFELQKENLELKSQSNNYFDELELEKKKVEMYKKENQELNEKNADLRLKVSTINEDITNLEKSKLEVIIQGKSREIELIRLENKQLKQTIKDLEGRLKTLTEHSGNFNNEVENYINFYKNQLENVTKTTPEIEELKSLSNVKYQDNLNNKIESQGVRSYQGSLHREDIQNKNKLEEEKELVKVNPFPEVNNHFETEVEVKLEESNEKKQPEVEINEPYQETNQEIIVNNEPEIIQNQIEIAQESEVVYSNQKKIEKQKDEHSNHHSYISHHSNNKQISNQNFKNDFEEENPSSFFDSHVPPAGNKNENFLDYKSNANQAPKKNAFFDDDEDDSKPIEFNVNRPMTGENAKTKTPKKEEILKDYLNPESGSTQNIEKKKNDFFDSDDEKIGKNPFGDYKKPFNNNEGVRIATQNQNLKKPMNVPKPVPKAVNNKGQNEIRNKFGDPFDSNKGKENFDDFFGDLGNKKVQKVEEKKNNFFDDD